MDQLCYCLLGLFHCSNYIDGSVTALLCTLSRCDFWHSIFEFSTGSVLPNLLVYVVIYVCIYHSSGARLLKKHQKLIAALGNPFQWGVARLQLSFVSVFVKLRLQQLDRCTALY